MTDAIGASSGSAPARTGRRWAWRTSDAQFWRTGLAAFVLLFAAAAAWSFASPLGSSPDEPAHLIRAASLVRGQLLGKPVPNEPAILMVLAPEVFASLANDVSCFRGKPQVPAGCQQPLVGSPTDVSVETYVGRDSPFYYALVGWPTLLFVSVKGIYAVRLVSGALCSAMLAWAVVSVRRCRGAPLVGAGLSLAISPMALYLAGAVTPSGLEISSAIAAWAGAMALASQRPQEVKAPSVAALGLPIVVLVVVRLLSPAWALVVLGALVLLHPWGWAREIWRVRSVKGWTVAALVGSAASFVWDVAARPDDVVPGTAVTAHASQAQVLSMALDRLHLVVLSSIGDFGWLDNQAPFAVTATWVGIFGALIVLAVSQSNRRDLAVTLAVVGVWAAIALGLAVVEARKDGVLGQGRDYMAVLVGGALLAGRAAGDHLGAPQANRRALTCVLALVTIGQVVAFYGALRRYTVGTSGPLNAFATTHGGWRPPLPAWLLCAVFALAATMFAKLVRHAVGSQPAALPLEVF